MKKRKTTTKLVCRCKYESVDNRWTGAVAQHHAVKRFVIGPVDRFSFKIATFIKVASVFATDGLPLSF